MPTYEYACRSCDEHVEVVQSFKDDPLTDCPACGGELRKVFSPAGIILKGGGWHIKEYTTTHRTESRKDTATDGTDGTKAVDDSSDGSSSSERATA